MSIESQNDLISLQKAGKVVARTLRELKAALRPGITTAELDRIAAGIFRKHGARSAPALAYGFPGTVLISVNDEVVHGIPGSRIIQPGDLVTLDVTAELGGYIADAAVSVVAPPISPLKQNLCICAQSAFRKATHAARAGRPLHTIGNAVEREVRRHGFSVIPELSGHGIGRVIHEEPSVPNFYDPTLTEPLTEGLVLTIEPILTSGSGRVFEDNDGWTVKTADHQPAAHHEHTLVITRGKPLLLTAA